MKLFKQFFSEATESRRVEPDANLTHIKHIEDYLQDNGPEGYHHARKTLMGMHDAMQGKASDIKLGTKYDGSPSLVFGRNPENGKFFVATKSAFNASPKINYTPEDIEKNHGHAPGLVEKLKAALQHLPKVAPKSGVYQGDVMYTRPDLDETGKEYRFTPNTITYSTPKNSQDGRKIRNAHIGVAVHTGYEGDGTGTLAGMRPRFMPNLKQFNNHPDAHIISTEAEPNSDSYSDAYKKEFSKHMDSADKSFVSMPPEAHDTIERHNADINTYINKEIRDEGAPNHGAFLKYVQDRAEKDIAKLKTQSAIDRKRSALNQRTADISHNKEHFDKFFETHKHLQNAKNVLVSAAENNQRFGHSIGGVPTGPEGTVAVDSNNIISKANNRHQFNRLNAIMGKMRSQNTNK